MLSTLARGSTQRAAECITRVRRNLRRVHSSSVHAGVVGTPLCSNAQMHLCSGPGSRRPRTRSTTSWGLQSSLSSPLKWTQTHKALLQLGRTWTCVRTLRCTPAALNARNVIVLDDDYENMENPEFRMDMSTLLAEGSPQKGQGAPLAEYDTDEAPREGGREVKYYDGRKIRRDFKERQRLFPDDVSSYTEWARWERRYGDRGIAKTVLKDGLSRKGQSEELWKELAIAEYWSGETKLAEEYLRLSLDLNPDNIAALHALGVIRMENKDIDEARELFGKAHQLDPADTRNILNLAHLEAKYGSMEHVREFLGAVLQETPEVAHLWTTWIYMEKKYGNPKNAREVFMQAVKLHPTNVYIYTAMGKLEHEQGNLQQARILLKLAYRENPKDVAVCHARAMIEADCGNVKQAQSIIDRCLQTTSENPCYAFAAKAKLFLRDGRVDDAMNTLRDGIALKPNAVLLNELARLLAAKGNVEEARTLFMKSLDVSPDNPHTLTSWATIERQRKNIPAALRLLGMAKDCAPQDPVIAKIFADIHIYHCDRSLAVKVLQEALEENKDNPVLLNSLSSLLLQDNKPRAVIEMIQEYQESQLRRTSDLSVAQKKSKAILLTTKGRAFARLHQYEDAIATFHESIQASPTFFCHSFLGSCHVRIKEPEKAVEHFQVATEGITSGRWQVDRRSQRTLLQNIIEGQKQLHAIRSNYEENGNLEEWQTYFEILADCSQKLLDLPPLPETSKAHLKNFGRKGYRNATTNASESVSDKVSSAL